MLWFDVKVYRTKKYNFFLMVISSIFADDFTNFLDERFLLTIFFSDLWGESALRASSKNGEIVMSESEFFGLLSHIIFAICSTLIWSNKQQLIFENTLVNWFEHTLLQHALKSIQKKMWTNKISFYRIPDTSSNINLQNILRKITVF